MLKPKGNGIPIENIYCRNEKKKHLAKITYSENKNEYLYCFEAILWNIDKRSLMFRTEKIKNDWFIWFSSKFDKLQIEK